MIRQLIYSTRGVSGSRRLVGMASAGLVASYVSRPKVAFAEGQRRRESSRDGSRQDKSEGFLDSVKEWLEFEGPSGNCPRAPGVAPSGGTKAPERDSHTESSSEQKDSIENMIKKALSFGDSSKENNAIEAPEQVESSGGGVFSFAQAFGSLITGRDSSEDTVQTLIEHAHEYTEKGDFKETASFFEIFNLFNKTIDEVEKSMEKAFGDLDLTQLDPAAFFYYLEHEDERKNPSWKRMMHRYYQGIDIKKVNELNDALHLSEIVYGASSPDDIRRGLKRGKHPLELVYCETESFPGKPSHFIALKKGQSFWNPSFEVVMVVRGTDSVADVLSDCLLEAEDFRGGRAHAGIVRSGKYLVEKHTDLLEHLLEKSEKRNIKLTLIGHSLGAGAASIAAMEFKDNPKMDVEVLGFGCPSLLSKDLSQSTKDYITTVIADSDIVPRMSGVNVANAALDIIEYDWTDKARRDVKQVLEELHMASPRFVPKAKVDALMKLVDSTIDDVKKILKPPTFKRAEPVLFPPGSCVHFYRDGWGVSGTYVPCTFFQSIDITRRMLTDHSIARGYRRIFTDLMRDYQGDESFSFDKDTK